MNTAPKVSARRMLRFYERTTPRGEHNLKKRIRLRRRPGGNWPMRVRPAATFLATTLEAVRGCYSAHTPSRARDRRGRSPAVRAWRRRRQHDRMRRPPVLSVRAMVIVVPSRSSSWNHLRMIRRPSCSAGTNRWCAQNVVRDVASVSRLTPARIDNVGSVRTSETGTRAAQKVPTRRR